MKLIKNKKGLIDDFGGLLIAGLLMVVVAIIILIYAGAQERAIRQEPLVISNLEDISYSTRIILDWETETGEKLKDRLLKHNSENTLEEFVKETYALLEQQGVIQRNVWLIVIKSKQTTQPIAWDTYENNEFTELTTRRRDETRRNAYMALPRIIMPDGERGVIEVIIKQVTQQDLDYYQTQRETSLSPGYSPVV